MSIDLNNLSNYSASELQRLIHSAQDQLEKGKRERVKLVREKIQALLKEENLTHDEVFGSVRGSTSRRTGVSPKYVSPEDSTKTWTGRGMQPKWFKEALAKGLTSEQLLIADVGGSTPPTGKGEAVQPTASAAKKPSRAPRKASPSKSQAK